ncbi:acyl-CoA N-acyltransferase [Glomus cerebriforme]|uniref:Histone acetyltransferase n=1 Tax=Glomus cerebriforme TaxID=658196 RepID=A0A397TIQ7_9GLOM|nr:acyl-CoA N-acyltransferase [Glomus cerebriforme]
MEEKSIKNGIPSSSPTLPLQKEQISNPAVTSSKKTTTPRKRKANKLEEKMTEIKTETILTDQPVIKEEEQSITVIKEKRKRNRVLPQRGKKANNESPQLQTQQTTQLQNDITQEQTPPPPQQPEKSTSPIQISQKARSPSTQKRKAKTSAITGPIVKENSLDNSTPVIPLEEAGTSVFKEGPKEVVKEEQKEISEVRKSQKKTARIIIKQKRKRVIKSKETISSGDEDLEEESIPHNIIKTSSFNETSRMTLSSQTKSSKKRGITNGMDNNKELKARITRQRTKPTNKGKRGRKKLIKLEDEEVERNISKVSDTETIQNETEEKQDQASNHISENRLVENGEHGREQAEDVDLPFGGRLTADEADTSKTRPDYYDKVRFENAKNKAEAAMQPRQEITFDIEDQPQIFADATPKIRSIRFGDWEMDTWYVAPYPEEYSWYPTLYICEYCLKYMKSKYIADRHKMKCPMKHPPGDEIYRDGLISIFEVDGRKNTIYCQNLCLLAKMFLDHKTLYYDVEPFLFYVMTEINDTGCHFVGYFSKEKRSPLNYNVSCILTLPIHQRKGYGNLLIEFSYLLTKRESKTGSPEKPLSDLGLLSYRYYWRNVLFEVLNDSPEALSIEELSRKTSMTVNDVIATLQINNMLVRDENGIYRIVVDKDLIKNHLEKVTAKGYPRIRTENLRWTPFILTRVLRRAQDLENEKNMSTQEQQNSIDLFNKIVDKMDVDE